MITLQAINTIITGTGHFKPGEVLKVSEQEAAFLIKKGAARETKNGGGPKQPDSPKKDAAKTKAGKAKASASKKKEKKAAASNQKANA